MTHARWAWHGMVWKVVYARRHHLDLSIGSSAIAMGRYHFTPLLLLALSAVSAQRTSQGVQQQFGGPRFQQQQKQIRSFGSQNQQPGHFRGARGPHEPVTKSSQQALIDSLNFDIPFRTPADIFRAPKRIARALWDIEVGE